MRRAVLVLLVLVLVLQGAWATEQMSPKEMEQAIYVLRWAIAKLAIEMMDVLIEVQHSDGVSTGLKGRAQDAIGAIYQILELLGIRIDA